MTDTPLDPTTNPDAQEALSTRYGSEALILVVLKSGNIAIFGRDSQLHTILYDAPSVDELRRLSREIATKLLRQKVLDAESAFLGEPSDRQMARDLRREASGERRAVSIPRPSRSIEPMEL
jgi:hypothetical protein